MLRITGPWFEITDALNKITTFPLARHSNCPQIIVISLPSQQSPKQYL